MRSRCRVFSVGKVSELGRLEDAGSLNLEVIGLLQMSEDQAMFSSVCLLARGWAFQAVSDLPLRLWLWCNVIRTIIRHHWEEAI